MIAVGLVAGVAVLLAAGLARAWPRSGPASTLRRGLWLLAPAAVLTALPAVGGALGGAVGDLLEVTAVALVGVAVLRAAPAREAGATREHVSEAVIAGLLVVVLVAGLLPLGGLHATGLVVLVAQAAALWLVCLGRHEIRLQAGGVRWLVAGGLAASLGLGLPIDLGWPDGSLALGAALLPALAWTAALAHPRARAPLSHVTRPAPRLAGRQIALLVAAVLIGPGIAISGPLLGRAVDGLAVPVVSGSLTLLVVVHLVQLVDLRGRNAWEAQHDALTGLPTEPLFEDRLRQAIAAARRSGSGLAVAFVDLDGFKEVNDTHGHEAGDEVLRQVAARLTAGLREQDTVARRSGDELLLLLADLTDPTAADEIVERLLARLAEPIDHGGERLTVGASVGLAAWPRDALDADELVQRADEAMYDAKAAGRGQVCWYRTLAATRTHLRLTLAEHLRRGLHDGELELDHQPLVDLRDGSIDGMMCRVRWRHPVLGRLTPSAFLPVATRSGLWRALDLEVVRLACEQARAWRSAGRLHVPLTVQLCDEHTTSEGLADDVLAIVEEAALPTGALALAVSESALCRGGETFARTVDVLADHGVEVVVTGFGSADVGIFRLSRVRIAGLELAPSLVARVTGVEQPVADTIVRLAQGLGIRVRAAGVSDDAQTEVLRSRGCMVARGPRLAPAIAGGALEARLAALPGEGRVPVVADLLAGGAPGDEAPAVDPLLTSALTDADDVLESELTAILRRVGESPLGLAVG